MQYLVRDFKDIDLLIESKIPEGVMIDYKQQMPDFKESKYKREFLKDICAFSNTHGGQIIFGIEEEQAIPISVCGVQVANPDDLKLQLLNIIRSGLESRVSGVAIDLIPYKETTLLIINIPPSWNAPHRVSFEGHNKFYGRTSGGNYELSITEIRDKFIMASTVRDRIKAFRDQRVRDILNGKFPAALDEGPKIMLHIIPLSAFASSLECDAVEIDKLFHDQNYMLFFRALGASGIDREITLDGLLTHPGQSAQKESHRACTQFYREGIVEAVATVSYSDEGGEKVLSSPAYERNLIKQKYLKVLQGLNFVPPFYFFLSLVDVKGYTLQVFPGGNSYREQSHKSYSDNEIVLREVVVDSFDVSPEEIFKPMFDRLCNAWGFSVCPHFNADGSYRHG